jgi:mono/diheme cytochrome c family protein
MAGTPPGNDAELVTLLTTGISRDGKPLRPPTPPFHMTREDADSVAAYLKSLGAGPQSCRSKDRSSVSNQERRKIAGSLMTHYRRLGLLE